MMFAPRGEYAPPVLGLSTRRGRVMEARYQAREEVVERVTSCLPGQLRRSEPAENRLGGVKVEKVGVDPLRRSSRREDQGINQFNVA